MVSDSIKTQTVSKQFDDKGFVVIEEFISNAEKVKCLSQVKNDIAKASKEINVSVDKYLSSTGRWSTESFITKNISNILLNNIKSKLENILDQELECKKCNVICKTAALTDQIPFHQDISYSPNDPYHFSLWISFNDVPRNSAPLEVVTGSHKNEILPAEDFWSPTYKAKYDYSSRDSEILEVQASDAIMFDSRIWHGSDRNNSGNDRFAYVTRWKIKNKNFPKIPEIKPDSFGMFNCGELTEKILRESIALYKTNQDYDKFSKEEIILEWRDFLTKNSGFEDINPITAIVDLKKLYILNRAYDLHDAGNISGLVYKNLWFSLLRFLANAN